MNRSPRLTRMLWMAALLAATVVLSSQHTASAKPTSPQYPSDCGIKIEKAPWAYSGDQVIIAVCIKAGTGNFAFNADGTDGCYTVSGLGTNNVTVSGGGTGRDCKDISNVVFYTDCNGIPG